MPKPLAVSEEALSAAKAGLADMSDARKFRRSIPAVLAAGGRLSAQELADLFQAGRRTVFDAISKISHPDKRPSGTWGGRRNANPTTDGEAEFLAGFERSAALGEKPTVQEMRRAYAEKTGLNPALSAIYRLLRRQGWRKAKPDAHSPKADPKLQEKAKKTSRGRNGQSLSETENPPVPIAFQDKAGSAGRLRARRGAKASGRLFLRPQPEGASRHLALSPRSGLAVCRPQA